MLGGWQAERAKMRAVDCFIQRRAFFFGERALAFLLAAMTLPAPTGFIEASSAPAGRLAERSTVDGTRAPLRQICCRSLDANFGEAASAA